MQCGRGELGSSSSLTDTDEIHMTVSARSCSQPAACHLTVGFSGEESTLAINHYTLSLHWHCTSFSKHAYLQYFIQASRPHEYKDLDVWMKRPRRAVFPRPWSQQQHSLLFHIRGFSATLWLLIHRRQGFSPSLLCGSNFVYSVCFISLKFQVQ